MQEVVCLVFQDDKKRVLLEQRLDEGPFHLEWTFPGGKLEDEDRATRNPLNAASIRESWEEMRLNPLVTHHFTSFEQQIRDGRELIFRGVWVRAWSGELQNPEAGRRILAWKAIDEARELMGDNPVDQRILEEFLKVR